MLNQHAGEMAALGAAIGWTLAPLFYTLASRRVGAFILNRTRLVLAVIFLAILHYLIQGQWLPSQAEPYRWFWLGLSGVTGQVVGDTSLFQALIWIGPRRTILLMSLLPIISTLFAWLFLGETLSPTELVAVALTVGGIAWVVLERGNITGLQVDRRRYWLGILLGFTGALGQSFGLVASKIGMEGDFAPLPAALIRMIVAAAVIWVYTVLRRQTRETVQSLADRQAGLATVAGTLSGPVLAVWLSFVAVKLTRVGLAATLMALPPVFILLPSRWLFKDQISRRAIAGTLMAIGGAALIFLL